ncbi:MAG: ABC transporter ATP-binding protein [Flavobacteriales bacterium]|nr:ABC transporter ATP-binding protein [Flavobacteriales bacterium]
MASEILFELDDISCKYGEQEVLRVEKLSLPKVPLTFILGASGIGKSTLLEMLGLMSDTFHSRGGKFSYNGDQNLLDFWTWPSKKQALFRRNNFSFVFQQTNLIENFSIIENLCIPLMIQGYSYDVAAKRVTETAQKMNLDEKLLNRRASAVSGGQLQRAAFTRALSTDFHVLFGDEPTGNLDIENSRTLMGLLKTNLQERHAAAVVVSHDVELAGEYADCIIRVRRDTVGDNPRGTLDQDCVNLTA